MLRPLAPIGDGFALGKARGSIRCFAGLSSHDSRDQSNVEGQHLVHALEVPMAVEVGPGTLRTLAFAAHPAIGFPKPTFAPSRPVSPMTVCTAGPA